MSAAVTTIRNVLLVEDNEAWAELTREAFADVDAGIDLRTVSSGQEALALLLGGLTPDLVLLDLNMPGVDGRDVLRALQGEPERSFDVVVLSASVAERDRILAHELGASAYCSKPTTFLQLRNLITELVQDHATGEPDTAPADPDPEVDVSPAPGRAHAGVAAGARIAVVEDSPLDASLITDQLTPNGFEVRTAGSIGAFRDQGLASWADCVLLDLDLPDAAGLDGLRFLGQAVGVVPIIVLTGNPSETLTIDALAAGAQDWVRKGSMNSDQLSRTIRFAIERARLQAQLSSERERFTAELSRSNADLADFAQIAAHDLRSPLQSVIGFSELLERRYGAVLDETGREYLDHIADAAYRMDTLIESLLSYSRVGTAANAVEALDLGEVLTAVRSALLGEITASGALVTAGNLPTVSGDRTQFSQLLQNLIGNAIKFVAPGVVPRIHVSARRDPNGWWLDVTDNGIGVPADQREQIFEMFSRGDRTGYGGTGVGLAVCQRVMQRRGGDITVASAPGGGSRFSCFFTDEWDHTLRVGPSLFATSDGLGLRPAPEGETARPVVLLVEDGDDHAALLEGMLEQAGTPVVWRRVGDLASARRLLAEDPPDCLVLDLHLPDSSGLGSLEEVRTAAPYVPVVVVTALADEAIAVEALRRGAQDYLLKGRVTADALSRTILFAIERQAQELSMVEAALTDTLTGLANRRCLADRLTAALGRAGRGEPPPAILLVDLDGFKAVNDERGHRTGDAVLVEVANRLRGAVRGTDTVARHGGDEFVVLCEGLDQAGAEEVSERVRVALAQPIPLEAGEVTLGASIGVVVARAGDAADDVLDRADTAMYAAKRPGR